MHKVYRRDDDEVALNKDEKYDTIILCILNYLLYCTAHVFGVSYYFAFILYRDAVGNPQYEDKTATDELVSENLIAVSVACVILLYGQQIYLSIKVTRHCLGVCMTTQLCTLLYLYGALNQMLDTSCEYRQLLTCYKNTTYVPLNNDVLENHRDGIVIGMLVVITAQTCYIIASMINNYKKRYFFSKKLWKEFLTYYLYYAAITCAVFILPVIIFACMMTGGGGGGGGGNDSTDCNCGCSMCEGTVFGREMQPNNISQTMPFGSASVSHYNKDSKGEHNV